MRRLTPTWLAADAVMESVSQASQTSYSRASGLSGCSSGLRASGACPSDSSPPAHTGGSVRFPQIQMSQVPGRMIPNCLPVCSTAVRLAGRLARCPQYACHSAAMLAGCIEGGAPGSIASAVAAGDSGVPARLCFRRERTGGGYGDCRRVALG